MDSLIDATLAASTSPWVYVAVFVLCVFDGFFPPMPSEPVVLAVASLAVATGQPSLPVLMVVVLAGAVIGDNVAYCLGRRVGVTRWSWMRTGTILRVVDSATREMKQRPASLILAGRFIPVGRVAINMVAGATGLPHPRFFWLSIVAGATWASYSCLIACFSGSYFHDNPLLGALVAMVGGVSIGIAFDLLLKRLRTRRLVKAHRS